MSPWLSKISKYCCKLLSAISYSIASVLIPVHYYTFGKMKKKIFDALEWVRLFVKVSIILCKRNNFF